MSKHKNINSLLKKYYKNTCTPEEKEIVEQFFTRLQEDGVSPKEVKKDLYLKNKIYNSIQENIAPKKKRWIPRSVAAMIAVLITTGLLTFYFASSANIPEYTIAEAKHGEQLRIVLEDSSIVYLNSGSSLQYPNSFKNLDQRNVILKGEGFFEVTKNKEQPFIVTSGNISTKVLGTKFSVNNFEEGAPTVVVTEGKVNVSSIKNSAVAVDILPDEKVVFNTKENTFQKLQIHAENQVAWIHGNVIFEHSNLLDVAKKLERRFNIEVVVTSKTDPNCEISGKYSGSDLSELLKSMRFINGVNYTYSEKSIELSGPCKGISKK